jgi:hypothetical protein
MPFTIQFGSGMGHVWVIKKLMLRFLAENAINMER